MITLVTGATGFVGSSVVRDLLAAGRCTRVLVRPNSNRANIDGLPVEISEGDLNDGASLERALDGCDALFHVAADYRIWVPDPESIYRVNVEGTRDLMLAALSAGVRRVVYTSSVATLGLTADGSPADETTPVGIDDMVGHYKRSKFLAEEVVQKLIDERGLPAVIVNPSTPVGPRDVKPTPTGRLIADAAAGRMPAYVDTGLNIVHVDDVSAGHLAALHCGRIGERYILGGENLSLKDILGEIARLTGRRPPTISLPHDLVLPIAYVVEFFARLTGAINPMVTVDGVNLARKKMFFSSAKAEKELGYRHRPAAEALADAVAWFTTGRTGADEFAK
ncbi:MAG: hopanoid-associated sugar epimerase [Rhodospirillaceae bacterium]